MLIDKIRVLGYEMFRVKGRRAPGHFTHELYDGMGSVVGFLTTSAHEEGAVDPDGYACYNVEDRRPRADYAYAVSWRDLTVPWRLWTIDRIIRDLKITIDDADRRGEIGPLERGTSSDFRWRRTLANYRSALPRLLALRPLVLAEYKAWKVVEADARAAKRDAEREAERAAWEVRQAERRSQWAQEQERGDTLPLR